MRLTEKDELPNDRALPLTLMHQHSYVGKRADKFTVEGTSAVDFDEMDGAIVRSGVAKVVEHYTMTCPECGADGRYDDRGEVVCEDESCGVVISGDTPVTLAVDYTGSRGYNGDGDDIPGHSEPMI